MKELIADPANPDRAIFGESTPPLEYEEWLERGREEDAKREKEEAARAKRDAQRRADAKSRRAARITGAAAESGGGDEDPVDGMSAADAVDAIGRMRSREKLEQIAANDTRASVKKAAEDRLSSL